ncbi:hypothetical protein [Hydrogenophaga sp.]|uniref:hypothetical protein n=1 Tax=Hydrogenophaga sp. TaxID=1904254 RepID=UPI002625508C|nr:hypothetical protein [Hydrogenophaga sp.]MCW5653084.1 hypothetical protein [Hydrogenophaga sp.]
MEPTTLFAKTDKGREALTSRPAGLAPRLRMLLIMVDGKRTVADLDPLVAGEGSAAPLLEQLQASGWVEAVDPSGRPLSALPPAPPEAGEPASAPPPVDPPRTPALPFGEARRLVVRFINDQLGPMGEQLALRVESCKSPVDLQALLPRVRDGLANFKGGATAQRFDQEVFPRLPRF